MRCVVPYGYGKVSCVQGLRLHACCFVFFSFHERAAVAKAKEQPISHQVVVVVNCEEMMMMMMVLYARNGGS